MSLPALACCGLQSTKAAAVVTLAEIEHACIPAFLQIRPGKADNCDLFPSPFPLWVEDDGGDIFRFVWRCYLTLPFQHLGGDSGQRSHVTLLPFQQSHWHCCFVWYMSLLKNWLSIKSDSLGLFSVWHGSQIRLQRCLKTGWESRAAWRDLRDVEASHTRVKWWQLNRVSFKPFHITTLLERDFGSL